MSYYYESMYFNITKEPSCGVEEALVSGNNPIPDAQITASSVLDDFHATRNARINNTAGPGAWLCADHGTPEHRNYIQVCLFVTPCTNKT